MGIVLLIILILLLVGSIPRWEYNRDWNNTPSGFVSFLLLILIILLVLRVIPFSF